MCHSHWEARVKDEAYTHQSWLCDGCAIWCLETAKNSPTAALLPDPVLLPMEMGSFWRGSCRPNPDRGDAGCGRLVVIQISLGKDCTHLFHEFSLLSHIPWAGRQWGGDPWKSSGQHAPSVPVSQPGRSSFVLGHAVHAVIQERDPWCWPFQRIGRVVTGERRSSSLESRMCTPGFVFGWSKALPSFPPFLLLGFPLPSHISLLAGKCPLR